MKHIGNLFLHGGSTCKFSSLYYVDALEQMIHSGVYQYVYSSYEVT